MISKTVRILSYMTLMVLLTVGAVYADTEIGKVTFVQGKADILKGGNLPAKPLQLNDPVFEKDTVRTKVESKVEISFKDGNVLRLAQGSRIDISEYLTTGSETKSTIKLPRGHVRAIVDKDTAKRIADAPSTNHFEVQTPNVVAGVRGSDGDIMFDPVSGDTIVAIREGVFYVYNLKYPDKISDVAAGYMVVIPQNAPPGPLRLITNAETMRNEKATDPDKQDSSQSYNQISITSAQSSLSSAQSQPTVTTNNIVKNSSTITNDSTTDPNLFQPPVTQYETAPLTNSNTGNTGNTGLTGTTPGQSPSPSQTPTPTKTYEFGGNITGSEFALYNGSTNSFTKSGSITGSLTTSAYSGTYTPFSFSASGTANQPSGYPLWAFAIKTSSTNSYINMNALAGGVSNSNGTIGTIVGTYTNSFDNTEGFVVSYSSENGGLFYPSIGSGSWSATGQLLTVPINPAHGIYGYSGYYYGFNSISGQPSRVDYGNDKYFNMTWMSNGLVYGTSYGTAAVGNVPVVAVGSFSGYYGNGVLQLTDIYKYMAASQYLYLACGDETGASGCSKTTPVTTLTYLNIPSVEIGRTNLSGSLISGADYVNVNMNNVVFFAPTSGAKPSIFAIGSITGSYSLGSNLTASTLLTQANQIYLSDFTKSGINVYFNFTTWSGGKWVGLIGPSFTSGAVSGGTLTGSSWSGTVIMNGYAGGTFGNGIIYGNGIGIVR